MKNKVIDKEQEKVKKFFHKLYDKSVQKGVLLFVNGIFIFLIMILCLIPIQELLADFEDDPWIMPGLLAMFSCCMATIRTSFFRDYTENQKSKTMKEFLKYYPISKKAIWKHKMMVLLPFLAKVTGVGLLLQMIVALIAYITVSWMNIVYVVGSTFFAPVLSELIVDCIKRTYVEE